MNVCDCGSTSRVHSIDCAIGRPGHATDPHTPRGHACPTCEAAIGDSCVEDDSGCGEMQPVDTHLAREIEAIRARCVDAHAFTDLDMSRVLDALADATDQIARHDEQVEKLLEQHATALASAKRQAGMAWWLADKDGKEIHGSRRFGPFASAELLEVVRPGQSLQAGNVHDILTRERDEARSRAAALEKQMIDTDKLRETLIRERNEARDELSDIRERFAKLTKYEAGE